MDVTFNNVLEGTRQYFMGLPKQAQAESSGQPVWPAGAPPPEEGAPALSGAPAPSSRPPSAAAAPPSTPISVPPRPPSEPIEPEPHIIHKATVMREAAEKRREQPDPEDEEEVGGALSPPSHIIRKPTPRTLTSPAPAPAAPCPSPARPPSVAPLHPPSMPESQSEHSTQYRSMHQVQTPIARPPDHFASNRPPDPYSVSRPPEQYVRYHYEPSLTDGGRSSHGPPVVSPQPSAHPRHSPQTYARLSSSMPQHASRLREAAAQSPPAPRYILPPSQPPPPINDRVPPIHHPSVAPTMQRQIPADGRTGHMYPPLPQRHDPSYSRPTSHYDRNSSVPSRKYDPQQAYPGYRPTPTTPPIQSRLETHHQVQYKHGTMEVMSAHYPPRHLDRTAVPPHSSDTARITARPDYSVARSVDVRSGCQYPTPSPSTARYGSSAPVAVVQNHTVQPRLTQRTATAPKPTYDSVTSNHIQTSPARSAVKPGYPNQPARMTVSVTTLVNQMNQTKQKRESPLDLSVKTVKNSADSSTTQDDLVDSASTENKSLPLQVRSSSNSRHLLSQGYTGSHKVDFAPDFSQYRDRNVNPNYNGVTQPVRYNGTYDTRRPIVERYPGESRHQLYDRSKYPVPVRTDYVPRIDLTRSVGEERHHEGRIRDDRLLAEERKRLAGPIVSNIPEKIVRYETWSSDSRIERMSQSAKEQKDLMSRPVYSYSSHKQFEAYQNEQKRTGPNIMYRENYSQVNHRYPTHSYPVDPTTREVSEYYAQYHDKSTSNSRHVIQKIPNIRDVHGLNVEPPPSGIPADKRVLSILRNSLETKQGFVEPPKPTKQIPDLIVIDDVDDSVIEITDLTKDNDIDSGKGVEKSTQHLITPYLDQHIQMPKAVDSVYRDSDYQRQDNVDLKNSSPENDVASRIRTKAELKVMPPSEESSVRSESKQNDTELKNDQVKLLPKSQKQHLFNQIREDLRLESVIKNEKSSGIPEVKVEPMNIEEIEKDAEIPIKTEHLDNLESGSFSEPLLEDLDWASTCDNFMEQLKSGCHKKKVTRRRTNTLEFENEDKSEKNSKAECTFVEKDFFDSSNSMHAVIIKQEPLEEEIRNDSEAKSNITNTKDKSDNITNETKSISLEERYMNDNDNMSVGNRETVEDKHSEEKIEFNNCDQNLINKHNNISITEEEKRKAQTEITKSSTDKRISKEKAYIKSEKGKCKEGENSNKTKLKCKETIKVTKNKLHSKSTLKNEKSLPCSTTSIKKETKEPVPPKIIIKEELESTDDDEPLIKSKLQKEKEHSDFLKYQLLKDLSEKTAYIKLECCDVDMNKNSRKSIESPAKDKDEKQSRLKLTRQMSRSKGKSMSIENNTIEDTSSDSDDDELCVASRLRIRKNIKSEEGKNIPSNRTHVKSSPSKKTDACSTSSSSTPILKPGFGDGSDFHPGWEEELYRYKRSLRMPPRLIAIPRGRSGGPFVGKSGVLFTRGSTSLPDLDPAPLSPAPSSAPSAATDDLYARRPDKLTLDSDLDSNSSCSAPHRLQYDSEASTSTIFSVSKTQKRSSIVDVLIQKCGKKDDSKKKNKDKDDKISKIIAKSTNTSDLLPTPSLGLMKNGNKGSLSAKKEKLMEDIFYLGAFRKETVTAFRNAFIKDTDGLIGATEEFAPVVLKSRTRTESRVLKQRATIKEVFGDERPASAPPTSCRTEDPHEIDDNQIVNIKKEEPENKPKLKSKKIIKDKLKRRSSSIRDGLRSTKSLKRNDAKGRLLRLKKRNSLIMSLTNKKIKEISGNKSKKDSSPSQDDKDKSLEEGSSLTLPEVTTKRRLKRLFGRRKFSSGFDYIRKKKKIIRKDDTHNKVRRPAVKPSPESIHDIKKEIKGWFINKSVGETHLHRAARLGYTDCVAYCLEKLEADPSAKDNAGFTPLHVASSKGHVRIARLLLQYGANVSAAAQGGIRPLHEACENCHVEVIRLLLSYGADPLLGTYAGQTPEELTEGPATMLLRLHIADIQGLAVEPWRFPPPAEIIDNEELGCDPLASPPPASPPPPPDSTIEIQTTDAPLPPFYSLRSASGQPADGLWCLLQDITNLLQIKSKDSLLKQIHCGSGSPKELLREIRTQEFLERAQCHQLLGAGEKVNVRASKVALVRVTDKLRQLLKIETVLVS